MKRLTNDDWCCGDADYNCLICCLYISPWRTHNGCACFVANAIQIDWILMMCCVMYADVNLNTNFYFLYCLVKEKLAALLLHLQSQRIALSSLPPTTRKVHYFRKIMIERSLAVWLSGNGRQHQIGVRVRVKGMFSINLHPQMHWEDECIPHCNSSAFVNFYFRDRHFCTQVFSWVPVLFLALCCVVWCIFSLHGKMEEEENDDNFVYMFQLPT